VPHNLELLRRGEEMSDAWYAGRCPIPGTATRAYARELALDEVRGGRGSPTAGRARSSASRAS
jgi:hypothetical protein